jgi:hypothetical protein
MTKNKYLTKGFQVLVVVIFSTITSVAQNSISNPYSLFGLGKRVNHSFYQHQSMGGVGNGFRNPNTYSLKNPASISAIQFTVFDVGLNTSQSRFTDGESTSSDLNSNFGYFALAIPIPSFKSDGFAEKIKLSSSLGLTEYSQYGFNFQTPIKQDEFNVNSFQNLSGLGSLNRIFFSLAANPIKGVALGVTYNRIFGSFNNRTLLVYPNNPEIFSLNEENFRFNSGNTLDFGVQFFRQIKKIHHTIGFTFSPSTILSHDGYQYIESFNGFNYPTRQPQVYDTIKFEDVAGSQDIPMKFGVGYGLNTEKLGIYADFEQIFYTNISDLINYGVRNERNVALGLNYVPKPDYSNKGDFLKKVEYRAGIYQTQHHFLVNNQEINEFGISFGLGIPVTRSVRRGQGVPQISRVNIGVEYASMGKASDGLFLDNTIRLTLSMNLNDKWFIKRKYL